MVPPMNRVLLIESGPRALAERFAPVLRLVCGPVDVDLLTCLPQPEADSPILPHKTYQTQNYATSKDRRVLLRELRANGYGAIVLLCADSPVLNRWKWWLSMWLPAKVLIANENADCFWLDLAHWRSAKGMLEARYGLHGAASLRTLAELVAFPFVLAWLCMFAVFVHAQRGLRLLLTSGRA